MRVEAEWLKALAVQPALQEVPAFSAASVTELDALVAKFSAADGERIKAIEATTNHDVKAVEYFLKERLAGNAEITKVAEFIHFACISEDINNLCHALMLQHARKAVLLPGARRRHRTAHRAGARTGRCRDAVTHPRPAGIPDHAGQGNGECGGASLPRPHAHRRRVAARQINGAVGNYNAHLAAYPAIDWEKFAKNFVESLGLEFNRYTTQRIGQSYPSDLILLDVMMPGMDGPATLEALREMPATAQTPVAFMTAKVQPNEIRHLLSLGAIDVIPKPVDPLTLSAQIREIWQNLPRKKHVHRPVGEELHADEDQ